MAFSCSGSLISAIPLPPSRWKSQGLAAPPSGLKVRDATRYSPSGDQAGEV